MGAIGWLMSLLRSVCYGSGISLMTVGGGTIGGLSVSGSWLSVRSVGSGSVGSGLSVSGSTVRSVGSGLTIGGCTVRSVGNWGTVCGGTISGLSVSGSCGGTVGGLSVSGSGSTVLGLEGLLGGSLLLGTHTHAGQGTGKGTRSEETLKSEAGSEFLSEFTIIKLVLEGGSTERWELGALFSLVITLNFKVLKISIDLDGIFALDFLTCKLELTLDFVFLTDFGFSIEFKIRVDLNFTLEFDFATGLKLNLDFSLILEFVFLGTKFKFVGDFELTGTETAVCSSLVAHITVSGEKSACAGTVGLGFVSNTSQVVGAVGIVGVILVDRTKVGLVAVSLINIVYLILVDVIGRVRVVKLFVNLVVCAVAIVDLVLVDISGVVAVGRAIATEVGLADNLTVGVTISTNVGGIVLIDFAV